ncbi:MAG TPA: DUF3182 family protein [Rudaea sp.]|jgi:hypothetical protein|nr:DUF3182 family protein [Rudaea sp.]
MALAEQLVTFCPDATDKRSHDYLSRCAVSQRLAKLLGVPFAGEYTNGKTSDSHPYFVPQNTLLSDEADALGIISEDDLFGGVVPHHFVATRAVTHDTVSAHARAPHGWSHALGESLSPVVLPGYSTFTESDIANGGRLLLRLGCVRMKPAHHLGGAGQKVITNEAELDAAIAALDKYDLHHHGVVLEQNLEAPVTYSIGEVRLRELRIAYFGTQRTTTNNHGEDVYGGTDLTLIRGGIDDLLDLDLTHSVRIAVTQAIEYDEAIARAFPTFFASRRNYDVVQGRDEQGRCLSGVLEQSWRYGGASAAEVAALKVFAEDSDLDIVRASTHEVYSPDARAPRDADVHFDGHDEHAGHLIKFCVIERDGG